MGINLGGRRLFGKYGVIWEMTILVSAVLFLSLDLKFCGHYTNALTQVACHTPLIISRGNYA